MNELILVFFLRRGLRLVGGCDPVGVGVKEEEENHAERHEIHVDEQEDAAVVEVPASSHAPDGVGGAGHGDEAGEDEERGGVVVGEVREEDGCGQTGEDEKVAAEKGTLARIEETGEHTNPIHLV
jgi:hypothetical protein